MPTIRLYAATKAKVDIDAVIAAATFTGNWTARKGVPRELAVKQRMVYDEFNAAMEEAKGIVEVTDDRHRAVAIRIAGEQDIARYLVKSLLEQGFELQADDNNDEVMEFNNDPQPILETLFDADMCSLNVFHPEYMVD